MQYP